MSARITSDKAESESLLTNDLRVLVSELNRKLEEASQKGIEVQLTACPVWVIANPAIKMELRIKMFAEIQ
jgi:hypothetical protein